MTDQVPEDALTRAMAVLSGRSDPLIPASTLDPAVPKGVAGVLQGSDLVIPAGTIGEVGLKHEVVLPR